MKRIMMLAVIALGCIHPIGKETWVNSCVTVICFDGHGSGSVIGTHLILTAAHVADSAVAVRLQDGTILPVVTSISHPTEDAAILIVAGDLPAILPISYEHLRRGDEVITIGSPYYVGLQGHMLFGRVANTNILCVVDPNDPGSINDVLDINVGPGISGAPVLRNGYIVGIMVGLINNYATMLPTASFKDLL